ncbi:MAG: UDP-4-amino-4,6-dideoxy-N-acetyl-beta-L-altrosamine transaminase [Candidatus Sumerlaeota bacterium]|nr:UDP-4-amino-4,6-dideoxy-N-acetyl-beta-L-altrosamine transaminase [Candidatus Sumerlaeota bacterium]
MSFSMIPYGRHLIEEDDIAAVAEVLRGGWLTQGPKVAEFEQSVAKRCGARHAVACNSGTAALHLAILAAQIGPGDEIVAPAITFLATANCGAYAGATPRFTDVNFDSVLMTPSLLESVLSDRTRAVLPVHFAGLTCDMPALSQLIRRCCPQAVIIEDACHALGGAHADGTPVGTLKWADMAMFSFHPVKHVATGEGGMILTDRDDLAERLRIFRNHGMTKDAARLSNPDEGPWYYEMQELGFNYRIPDMNCALGLSQMGKLDRFIKRRREIAAMYFEQLSDLRHISLPPAEALKRSAWHIFCLHIDYAALGKSRKQVGAQLTAAGVGTQVHYYPVPLQPWYRKHYGFKEGDFPEAEKHYEQALTIPLFPGMSDADVAHVVKAIKGLY